MAHLKNLTQLKAAGGVVSREPIKKQVTWAGVTQDGEPFEHTFDILVVRPDTGTSLDILKNVEDDKYKFMLYGLSKYVMMPDDKGAPKFVPFDEWRTFEPELNGAIWDVVQSVLKPKKNLAPPTNSSVNSSPAALAGEPSKKLENA